MSALFLTSIPNYIKVDIHSNYINRVYVIDLQ